MASERIVSPNNKKLGLRDPGVYNVYNKKDSILSRAEDPDPDPLLLSPPDPVLFSADPDSDPDPTYNNGFIKLFSS